MYIILYPDVFSCPITKMILRHITSYVWSLFCHFNIYVHDITLKMLIFDHFSNEYLIFQKITKLDYEFPEGFHPVARDLVEQLLVSVNNCTILNYEHPFFPGVSAQFSTTNSLPFLSLMQQLLV